MGLIESLGKVVVVLEFVVWVSGLTQCLLGSPLKSAIVDVSSIRADDLTLGQAVLCRVAQDALGFLDLRVNEVFALVWMQLERVRDGKFRIHKVLWLDFVIVAQLVGRTEVSVLELTIRSKYYL